VRGLWRAGTGCALRPIPVPDRSRGNRHPTGSCKPPSDVWSIHYRRTVVVIRFLNSHRVAFSLTS
jgi:hypothetical protein